METRIITRIISDRAEMVTPYELKTFHNVDVQSEFDYLTSDDDHEPRFVKVHDDWIDVLDTMYVNDPDWDAYIDDTFFSRFVVKFLNGDDDGFVRIGFQTS